MKVSAGIPSRTSRTSVIAVIFCLISIISAHSSQASYVCHFDAFTSDGGYYDDQGMNMYVVVSAVAGQADFTFYNGSLFQSSIARIYFDNDTLGDISSIINGPGTNFSEDFPGPGNLPAGRTLDTPFEADVAIGAIAAPPHNGINPLTPQEWVRVSFDLPPGETLEDIVGELDSGEMRIGMHIIALPDGSSESAISVPEPGTICLLGLGGLSAMRRRRDQRTEDGWRKTLLRPNVLPTSSR